jgi:guanylate kinase
MILIVSAPSGTGKTTVLGRVLAQVEGLRFSVSHTTRAPRSGERDGCDYHFATRAEFEALVQGGRFLEWASVHGELYGTSLDEYERALRDGVDLLLDVDVQGAAQVRARLSEAVSVFLLPPSRAALEQRLRGRGGLAATAVEKRLLGARAEVARLHEYDYALVNEDVDVCAQAVEAILRAGRLRTALRDEAVEAAARSFEE